VSNEPLFITVEGIDGTGKTTLVNGLAEELEDVRKTAEPCELWTGRQVRRAITNESDVSAVTTFYLFMADRMHHINNIVKPALHSGKTVISDRYADSSRVYQSLLLADDVDNPEQFLRQSMTPWNFEADLTLLIDLDPEKAIERVEADERYEKLEFLEEVAEGYDELAESEEHGDRIVRIDGDQSKDGMIGDAVEAIRDYR